MRILFLAVVFTSFLAVSSLANSQIVVDTIKMGNGLGLGPAISLSTIEYENENNDTFEVERKTIGLGIVGGLSSDVSILFQIGYNLETEFEDSDLEGKGYMLGGGASFRFFNRDKISLIGYGLLNYVADTYELKNPYHKKRKIEMSVTDLHLGFVPVIKASNVVSLYAGLDLVPFSKGEIDYKEGKLDIERENLLNLKLGLEFTLPGAAIKPEVTLIGEKTFTLMATFNI